MADSFLKLLDKILPPGNDPGFLSLRDYVLQSEERGKRIIASLKPYADIRGKRILDIGCGDGGVAVAFAKAGARVAAIDASEENLALAALRSEEAGVELLLLRQRAESLAFEKESFDGVLMIDFLEYTLEPSLVFEHLNRVLKPGGFCYLAVLNRFYWHHRKFRHPRHKRFYFYWELAQMLKKNGFQGNFLREEILRKLENVNQIQTPWRRSLAAGLRKMGLGKILRWWVCSTPGLCFEVYWKIVAVKTSATFTAVLPRPNG